MPDAPRGRKRGRPRKSRADVRSSILNARLTEEEAREFGDLAKRNDRKPHELARAVLIRFLRHMRQRTAGHFS